MDLLQLKAEDGRAAWDLLADATETSVAYLSQIAHGHRKPSFKMAQKLVDANSKLTLRALLPELFRSIDEAA